MSHIWKNPCRESFVFILLCLTLSACVDPFSVQIPATDPILVVDGKITDQPGPYTVWLSWSSTLEELKPAPVTGARVSIEEEGGPEIELTEAMAGQYVTDSTSLQGQAGKRYRLLIKGVNENNYQSDWVELKASPPIDEVHYEFKERYENRFGDKGAQFYVDAFDPSGQTQFYRWEWEATWVHVAPFASDLQFVGNDSTILIPRKGICWQSLPSNQIYVGSSLGNETDRISRFPLHFVRAYGSELRYRYSLLLRQFALTEAEFLFWKRLETANENSGGLYETQPQSTTGNVFNLQRPDEPVLGYFSATGVQEERIFIGRSDLPDDAVIGEAYIYSCIVRADTFFKPIATERDVFEAMGRGQIFYNFFRDPDIRGWILTTKDCNDCTYYGGTLERPDFW